ncbi:DUF6702 family protein [Corallincola platygyrae]|uniref:DUF6702 family protein n=1 Tax=Corallincola platygyrae TaxID=1193278 RepID=A0ABW4XS39_9GAMM
MNRLPILTALFTLLVVIYSKSAFAHTYHATLTDIRINPQTNQMEVVHRFFADDVAKVLSAETGTKVKFGDKLLSDQEPLIQAYVEKQFVLTGPDKQRYSLSYVGAELDTHYLFVYQEAPAPKLYDGYQLKNNLLFGHLHDQINTVNIKFDGVSQSLVFTPREVRLPISRP